MSRQLEEQREVMQARKDREVLKAIEFELLGALSHAGCTLAGFSIKFGEVDVLMTLRGELAGRRQVSFVGAPTLSDVLRKAVGAAYRDQLRWREDDFQK